MKPVPTRKENYLLSDLCRYPLSTPLFRDVFWLLHVFKENARLFTVKYGHTIIKSVTDCWPVCTELYAKKANYFSFLRVSKGISDPSKEKSSAVNRDINQSNHFTIHWHICVPIHLPLCDF